MNNLFQEEKVDFFVCINVENEKLLNNETTSLDVFLILLKYFIRRSIV